MDKMVVPINNIVNGNKPKENVTVHYSTNLTTSTTKNPLVNPNFANVQNGKTLNPTQQITVVGKGKDPEVIVNHPTNINPYAKEQSKQQTETQTLVKTQTIETTTAQSISINPEKVFGPFYHGQNIHEAQEVLQITNGLTLPEIFNILSQYGININNWANANITISGNKIILNYTYSGPLESVLPNQSRPIGNITNNYTLEIENVNGWVVVKYKNYQTSTYEGQVSSPSINETYYVINPITKKVAFTGPNISEAVIWNQPIMSVSDAINGALSQYGYTLTHDDIEKVNNLQPGQSITVYATDNSYKVQLKITNLGNGQYEIQSTTPLYDNGQWININETVNIPMATENVLTGSISTGSYNIQGTVTLLSSSSSNASALSTYSINETIPITYTIKGDQIIFQTGNSQGGLTLQSGQVMPGSDVIESILQQYGYQLTSQELQEINNLQPGQSVTIQGLTPVKVTYLGNNQYQIQTVGNPFTTTGQEVGLDLTVTIPTFSINQQTGQISTTNLSISGTVTTSVTTTSSNGIAEIFPYQTETYNINETIPITYTTSGGQITFQTGSPQGTVTLQSISLPIITTQQLQELQSGQMPPGIKPGAYYNPQTGQIIQVSYPTVQQPSTSSSSQYSYVFYNPNVPYSTTNPNVAQYIAVNTNTDTIYFLNPYGQVLNSISFANTQALNNYLYQNYGITLTNNGPTITTSTSTQTTIPTITINQSSTTSLSIPTIISDIWNDLTTIGSDIYSWFASLSKPQNNTLQLNYQQLGQEVLYSQTPTSTTTSYSITTPTNQPQILQYSFFSPQILSDIWTGLTTLREDVYNWFTGLFSSKGSTSSSNITNYNYPSTNLSNIYQGIQNWETNNYNQYVQTLTKPTYNVSNIIINTNSNLGNNIYQTSQYLQNLELWQEIENNPNYPFSGTNNPYSPFNSIPIITDTTMTWNQIQYETNPQYRAQIEQTKSEVQNWEWGVQTYNFYSNLASLLGLKESAQYYQNLAQQAQQYGSPAFYQAESIGSIERAIAPSLILAPLFLPFSLANAGIGIEEVGAEEVGSSILPQVSASTALTRIGINAAIGAAENVAAGEATSYVLTGKPLSTQQALELAGIGAITGGIAGGFSLFSESANPTLASFGAQFTPLNFAKNLGLNIGGSLIGSNIYSYITSGQLPSLQQDIYSIEEAGPMTLAYSSIAGILESPNIANRFLKLITSPNSNKYWPIAARVLYDTGINSLAMFGSSLTAQGVGNIIGAQQGINLEEAAISALFAGALTFGFEGFRAFKNPGEFVKSLGYYPMREATINADTLRVIRKGNYDIEITGKGIVPEARPMIGNRIYTEKDFANVKPISYEFDISGNIKVEKMNGNVEIPLNDNVKFEKSLNEPGQTYYSYKGIITTSTEKSSLLSNIKGMFKAQGISNVENTEDYMNLINTEQEELEKIYPQFKELRNVPKKGLILSRNFLDNRLIPFVQNVNAGQDVLTASINTAEDIAGSRFVSLLTSSNYLANQGYILPSEIDQLLGTTSRQYNNLISELENIKQEAYNEIANNAISPETIRVANLKGIDNVIMPEDLKMNMGKLPNPNFINRVNRVIYYINAENEEALPNVQYVTIQNVENPYGIKSFGFSSPLYKETNINSNIQPITNRDLLTLARLNNANFVRSVSNILNLMRSGAISQDEAQILLENEVRQYYNRLNYIKSLNQKIPSNIKPEDAIWQYLYGAKPYNLDLYSNNLNLYNPYNKVYIVGDVSIAKTNLGETYRTMGEGIIANSDSSSMGTIFQVMRNNNGKTWFSVQQSTTIPISKEEYLTFSYQEAVDPNTLMLQAFGREIQGQPLSPEELQIVGKYLGQSKVIAPPKGIIRPYTNYGFSIVGTNQNAINVNNNYNIGMSKAPNANRNQLETNMIQTQYIEHPQLNEYNIQNELNVYRNKALENLRQDYLSSISTMNSLQNQFSRDNLYGLKNIVGLQNIQGQSIRGREKQVERLRTRQKEMERQNFVNIEKVIVPQILIEEGLAVGSLLDIGIGTTTKIKPKPILPPPTKHEPNPSTPPTPPKNPPKEPIPFGFPEITIMGQPIRGLGPGLGRGVRTMYDIQYALSRLEW